MLRRMLQTGCPLRRKNLRVRNSRKRERTKDRFTPSLTKEAPLHPWFNAHRARVLLQEYQRMRNMNRHTITYDEDLRKEFAKAASEYNLFKMHQFFGDCERMQATDIVMDEALAEAETLPTHLREEVLGDAKENSSYDRNEDSSPFIRYFEQMIRIYPPVLVDNLLAARRISEVAFDSLKFHDS